LLIGKIWSGGFVRMERKESASLVSKYQADSIQRHSS
jgi:hypothetical protein